MRRLIKKAASRAGGTPAKARQAKRLALHRNPNLIEYEVSPKATDPSIKDWLEPHYAVVDPTIPPLGKLFLFLSGSHGIPDRQRLIVQQAAELGYHAIGLRYPNSWEVSSLCRKSRDGNCHESVRLEILDGVSRSQELNIGQPDSIYNRLIKALVYLDRQTGQGGWSQYLDDGEIRWPDLVVAGHSQGGGHAAIIGKRYEVSRVIMMGAPADTSRVLQGPSPWLSGNQATPPERYFGFVHLQDRAFDKVLRAWDLLGLSSFGEPVNVDSCPVPFQGSHQLITGAKPSRPGKYHGSVVVDHATPVSPDGVPVFKQVWKYLCSLTTHLGNADD